MTKLATKQRLDDGQILTGINKKPAKKHQFFPTKLITQEVYSKIGFLDLIKNKNPIKQIFLKKHDHFQSFLRFYYYFILLEKHDVLI